jgi:hypothetical protein
MAVQNALGKDTNLPGNPTTTTQVTSDSSTRVATTAFVNSKIVSVALEDFTQAFLFMGA